MTEKEVATLFMLIAALYPNDKTFVEPDLARTQAWAVMLSDIPFDTARHALQKQAATNKFPPTIAEIRACAVDLNGTQALTADEAYGYVRRAIAKFGHDRQLEAKASMPPLRLR